MILLIGGNGFIGRHLIVLLNEHGIPATIVTRGAVGASEAFGGGRAPVVNAQAFALLRATAC